MRRSWTLGVAWLAVLSMGAATLPAALMDCHRDEMATAVEPQAGSHCPVAAAATRSLDCCEPGGSAEGEGAPSSVPSLPDCCFEAPQEPEGLPVAASIPLQKVAPVLAAPERVAGAEPSPGAFLRAPAALDTGPPPEDLRILHASFLI